MFDCWQRGLFGGLKKVEMQMGIPRITRGLDGYDAMRLWNRYEAGDGEALRLLLLYNKEDVVNLSLLKMLLDLA